MSLLPRLLFPIILAFSSYAYATNYEDLWWSPTESGWGVNVTQQHDIIFATWFIYDTDRKPLWLSMSRGEKVAENIFSGPLYLTNGPGYSGAFNPETVTRTQVGGATFNFTDAKSGVLSYTVNGVVVNKNITRQTFRDIPFEGRYYGSAVTNYNGCSIPNGNYFLNEQIDVSRSGSTITIREQAGTDICTSQGPYTQYGSLIQASGTYTCNNGTSGTWIANDIRATENSFVAKVETTSGPCKGIGSIGGVKQ